MRRLKVVTLGIVLVIPAVYAQERMKKKSALPAYFSGQIKGAPDSPKIIWRLYRNYLVGATSEADGGSNDHASVDQDGKFEMIIPQMERPGRIFAAETNVGIGIIDNQIVEPGDSIHMVISAGADGNTGDIAFTGRGAAKYNCLQELNKIEDNFFEVKETRAKMRMADSVLAVKLSILKKYRDRIDPDVYNIIVADVIGKTRYYLLSYAYKFVDIRDEKELAMFCNSKEDRELFYRYTGENDVVPEEAIAQSTEYITYLSNKEKIDLIYQLDGKTFSFKDFYYSIRNKYKGELRDRLLACSFANSTDLQVFFKGCNADDYTSCLKDALHVVKAPWIKKYIDAYFSSLSKGSPAFEFSLPADSSGRMIKLSDFRGKVVLLDMWSYNCTGCYLFANAFHERVFPLYKDNPDFKVVSMMLGDAPKDREGYLRRLRGTPDEYGAARYTFPEYTNLYGGRGSMGMDLMRHYNIYGMPAVYVIDKKGRIFSSTFHIFSDKKEASVDTLIQIINSALEDS